MLNTPSYISTFFIIVGINNCLGDSLTFSIVKRDKTMTSNYFKFVRIKAIMAGIVNFALKPNLPIMPMAIVFVSSFFSAVFNYTLVHISTI